MARNAAKKRLQDNITAMGARDRAAGGVLHELLAELDVMQEGIDAGGGNFTPAFTAAAALTIDDETYDRTFLAITAGFGSNITLESSVAAGTTIQFLRSTTNAVTFIAGSGVTINSKAGGLVITAQYGVVTAYKFATNVWILHGDI